jgi:hypothetical protein
MEAAMTHFCFHLDHKTTPTAEETRYLDEALRTCGSPRQAALALLRLTRSLSVDLTRCQELLGSPLPAEVFYRAPDKEYPYPYHLCAYDAADSRQ